MAMIAEKIGVIDEIGAAMLLLVKSRPIYKRVSPIPKAINPLRKARDSRDFVHFVLTLTDSVFKLIIVARKRMPFYVLRSKIIGVGLYDQSFVFGR